MIDGIKSRKLTYVDEAGNEGPVLLSLESRGTKRTDLGDSAFLDEVVGAIRIESEPITYTIELTGEDEIQLIFRLLWMADIYVQTRFRSQGYDIYKRELGDVTRESGIYN